MGRVPCCDKVGLKKGPWTPEEDQKLVDYIQKHGPGRWKSLPKRAGLNRCGKSCRLRWTNYLRPDIKRGKFSFEEEETIIQLHSVMGNKWSAIAARLPGRTDNEIKNYWNTHIRKKLLKMGIDPVTHSPPLDLLQLASLMNSPLINSSQTNIANLIGLGSLLDPNFLNLATVLVSSQLSNQELILQKLQKNQLGNYTQFSQNQFASSQQDQINQIQSILQKQLEKIQPCPTSNTPTASLPNIEQSCPSENTTFGCQSSLPNMWQNSEELPNLVTSPILSSDLSKINNSFSSGDQDFFPDNKDFSFSSLLNSSSSTHANGSSTEDTERDSYCSNMLMFDSPNIFDVNGIL